VIAAPTDEDSENGRKTEHHEGADAYRFDALIALAHGSSSARDTEADRSIDRSRDVTRIRIDLNSLLSGRTEPGEVCELPGVGPIPVSHARKVLSHGLLELVITDGVDVQAVVSTTRHVPNVLRIAIEERDPTCKIRDGDADQHLHRHHVDEYVKHRRTTTSSPTAVTRSSTTKTAPGHSAHHPPKTRPEQQVQR